MKPREPWHETLFGRIALFLGSVRLAVPVLAFVAVAMACGTYLESTQNAKVARAAVYVSWWFVSLMALVCVSLVFAVITRYPWKRRHVGFITVHAGLLLLMAGGFWSMFGRVEGQLALEEGQRGESIELDEDVFELVEFNAGQSTPIALAAAPHAPGKITLGGVPLDVVDVWSNTSQEEYVANDNPRPYRAIEIVPAADATQSEWIGDADPTSRPATLRGLQVRVLPPSETWTPPAAPTASEGDFVFVVGDQRYPLGAEGAEAFPGWTITSLRRFTRATVTGGGLVESTSPGGEDNPAIDITISDGKGTIERHTAFAKFPDMIMGKRLEGDRESQAALKATGTSAGSETFVVYGPADAPKFAYVAANGQSRELNAPKAFPAAFDLDGRRVTILNYFTNTRAAMRFVKGPEAKERRPAIVLKGNAAADTVVVPWKQPTPIAVDGRNLVARYGPRVVPLPFTIRLEDFRKMDYPGTEMAMSYESDVIVSRPGHADLAFNIFMNNPYAQSPWKVYQSGFIGENISVFSVMKDPGIPLTYFGSVVLCVGIYLTFFTRTFSWGHPGIPTPFASKESENAPSLPPPTAPEPAPVRAAAVSDPVGAGV